MRAKRERGGDGDGDGDEHKDEHKDEDEGEAVVEGKVTVKADKATQGCWDLTVLSKQAKVVRISRMNL